MVAIFGEKVSILKYLTSPAHNFGRGVGRAHLFYCEMFIIGRNLTIFPVWL